MTDTIFGNETDQWVCPNDRQLALRAKLHSGWSVHTYQTDKKRKNQSLDQNEIESIIQVIRRAEKVDTLEQQRIGRLVERLENMRKNVMGNGMSQCLLCGEHLGLLGTTSVFCQDCKKVWKRSGAWFFKAIPKYILPLKVSKTNELHLRHAQAEPQIQDLKAIVTNRTYTWAKGRVATSDSESDSDVSSSSLDEKMSLDSKNEKYRKSRIDSVSSTEPTITTVGNHKKHFGGMLSSGLSGSLTSLGSDRGAVSATESCPGEFIEGYDSDISRRAPGKHRGNLNLRR
ncbi:rab effector Noc2 isoform X2 [Ranitomeya imitator]|uniref:rab effector Noc2 isoform X2 n=1 Tax=Ranitomeya imitator TaxID=111125 RepID=UPI0037E86AD9